MGLHMTVLLLPMMVACFWLSKRVGLVVLLLILFAENNVLGDFSSTQKLNATLMPFSSQAYPVDYSIGVNRRLDQREPFIRIRNSFIALVFTISFSFCPNNLDFALWTYMTP